MEAAEVRTAPHARQRQVSGTLFPGRLFFAITLNFVQLANERPDLAAPLNALTRAMW
jgi:hypothetical protein